MMKAVRITCRVSLIPTVVAVALQLAGCGRNHKSTAPPSRIPQELTRDGWTAFEEGKPDVALAAFDAAVSVDPNYGPAYIGQGWSRLGQAEDGESLSGALTSFDHALALDQAGAETRAGRAATLLALGGSNLEGAIDDARSARTLDPDFIFIHRTTFTSSDLLLIEAFALASQDKLTEALKSAERIEPSGISPEDPSTWAVGGITYATFEDAALAYLYKLSDEHAG